MIAKLFPDAKKPDGNEMVTALPGSSGVCVVKVKVVVFVLVSPGMRSAGLIYIATSVTVPPQTCGCATTATLSADSTSNARKCVCMPLICNRPLGMGRDAPFRQVCPQFGD